jgi:hypothetical protein
MAAAVARVARSRALRSAELMQNVVRQAQALRDDLERINAETNLSARYAGAV